MEKCSKCGREIIDYANFCDNCGFSINKGHLCSKCGNQVDFKDSFCPKCGTKIKYKIAKWSSVKSKKVYILLTGICIAVIAAIIIAIFMWRNYTDSDTILQSQNYVLYLTKQGLSYVNLNESSRTVHLLAKFDDMYEEYNTWLTDNRRKESILRNVTISKDDKYIFYPDRLDYGENDSGISVNYDGFTLFYREIGETDTEPHMIDESVCQYFVDSTSMTVTYTKYEDAKTNLYQYSISDNYNEIIAYGAYIDKIAEDGLAFLFHQEDGLYIKYGGGRIEKIIDLWFGEYVSYKKISKDYKNILFSIEDDLYIKHGVFSAEKLVEDYSLGAPYGAWVDEEFSIVYYIKNNAAYKYTVDGGKTEKIISNVNRIYQIYENGEIYYTTDSREMPLINFVVDDVRGNDDYDALREVLKKENASTETCCLCFYDGKNSTVITNFCSIGSGNADMSEITISYNELSLDFEKMKLSEVDIVFSDTNYYDVKKYVRDKMLATKKHCIAVRGDITDEKPIAEKAKPRYITNKSETIAFYLGEVGENRHGTLYRVDITNGNMGEPKVYDSNVYVGAGLYFATDEKFVYYKSYEGRTGDLYINKNKIDSDIYSENSLSINESSTVCYFANWNQQTECGTMRIYRKGKITDISNVHSFVMTPKGDVLYIQNYNLYNNIGDLYQWSVEEIRKLDNGVVYLVSLSKSRYYGSIMW